MQLERSGRCVSSSVSWPRIKPELLCARHCNKPRTSTPTFDICFFSNVPVRVTTFFSRQTRPSITLFHASSQPPLATTHREASRRSRRRGSLRVACLCLKSVHCLRCQRCSHPLSIVLVLPWPKWSVVDLISIRYHLTRIWICLSSILAFVWLWHQWVPKQELCLISTFVNLLP